MSELDVLVDSFHLTTLNPAWSSALIDRMFDLAEKELGPDTDLLAKLIFTRLDGAPDLAPRAFIDDFVRAFAVKKKGPLSVSSAAPLADELKDARNASQAYLYAYLAPDAALSPRAVWAIASTLEGTDRFEAVVRELGDTIKRDEVRDLFLADHDRGAKLWVRIQRVLRN